MRRARTVRITVTIPEDVLDRADELAAKQRRSRSWVISEAVRTFSTAESASSRKSPARLTAGLGDQRIQQLEADLRLTPAQRVREAEELFETALKARPQPRYEQVLMFERFEDYLAWKRHDLLV